MLPPPPKQNNWYQLAIPSLSRLFGSAYRGTFREGERAVITVIKQLHRKGGWLIGLKGHVLRAESHIALSRGARLPVSVHIEGDALFLRIRAATQEPALASATDAALRHYPEFRRVMALLSEKGFTGTLSSLASILVRNYESNDPRRNQGERHSAGKDERGSAAKNIDEVLPASEDAERLTEEQSGALALFNHLSEGRHHWMMLPFSVPDFSLYGAIRICLDTELQRIEHAAVVIERSPVTDKRWAIATGALYLPAIGVTLYAEDDATVRYLSTLLPLFKERLRIYGVNNVEVVLWNDDSDFDGFMRYKDSASAVSGVDVYA